MGASTRSRDAGKKGTNGEAGKDGPQKFHCLRCGHFWTAHSRTEKCPKPKCQSEFIETVAANGPWECDVCEYVWWANGEVSKCPQPDCGCEAVHPLPGAVRCTTCNCWRAADELSCPDCGNRESSTEPAPPAAPNLASEALAAGRKHLNGKGVLPGETSTTTPAGIARFDPDAVRPPEPIVPLPNQMKLELDPPAKAAKGKTPPAEEYRHIAPRDIVPNPDNPRRDFDEADLAVFAEGIRQQGILEPLLVRLVSIPLSNVGSGEKGFVDVGLLKARTEKRFMLLGGERRWRSAKMLKLATVPCRVFDVTDEEAAEILARENDHKDLNPIEKARQYQLLMDRCGLNQETLAKRYGISQETVSRSLRLLQLAEPWLTWLIQRRITPMHAHELITWQDVPGFAAKVAQQFPQVEEIPSASEFRDEVLIIVDELSMPIEFESYQGGGGCKFRPSKDEQKQLDIRNVPSVYGGKAEKRAFNVPLWKELNAAAKKRAKEKAPKQKAPKRNSFKEDQIRWASQRAEKQFGKSVLVERCNYLGGQISEALSAETYQDLALRVVLVLLATRSTHNASMAIAKALGGRHGEMGFAKALGSVVSLKSAALGKLIFEAVRDELARPAEGRWHPRFNGDLLDWMAKTLKVTELAGWTPSAAFIAGFPESRLLALVDQFPEHNASRCSAGDRTTAKILANWPPGFIPRELLTVTAAGVVPKVGGKKKAKAKARAS